MSQDIVRIKLEQYYPYNDFEGWYESLDDLSKEQWRHTVSQYGIDDDNTELITKKAMELYCLEMDIDYIPRSEEFLQNIVQKFHYNFKLANLRHAGLVEIQGKLDFIGAEEVLIRKTKKGLAIINQHTKVEPHSKDEEDNIS